MPSGARHSRSWHLLVQGQLHLDVLPVKPIPWIEEQTGVAYATLKKHDGRWLPRTREDEASSLLERLARSIELRPPDTISKRRSVGISRGNSGKSPDFDECRGGESNPYTLAGCGF
jgi:hypothetical protein